MKKTTWSQKSPKMDKLLRLKILCNQLAELELRRVQQIAERMQQTVTLAGRR